MKSVIIKAIITGIILTLVIYLQSLGIKALFNVQTTIVSFEILERGKLPVQSLSSQYLGQMIKYADIELSYPIPSILEAIYLLIAGSNYNKVMILTLSSTFPAIFALTIYYVIAKKVLGNKTLTSDLLGLLFLGWIAINNVAALHVSRANFGANIIVPYIFYSLILLLSKPSIPSFLLVLLFTIMSGFTYYTSTIGIIVLTMMLLLVTKLKFHNNGKMSTVDKVLSIILMISILLTMYNSFVNSFIKAEAKSFHEVVLNLIKYMRYVLRQEGEETVQEFVEGYGCSAQATPSNFLSIATTFIGRAFLILSVMYIIYLITLFFIKRRSNKLNDINISLFVLVTGLIALSITEVFYLLQIPILSFRFISKWNVLLIFHMVLAMYNKLSKLSVKKTNFARYSMIVVILISVTIVMIVKPYLYYNGMTYVKVYGLQKFASLSAYLLHGTSEQITVYGDVWYVGYLMYYIFSEKPTIFTSLALKALGQNAKALAFPSTLCFSVSNLIRNGGYLLINNEGVVYGSSWGIGAHRVCFDPENVNMLLSNCFSKIYEDEFFRVFTLLLYYQQI